MTSISGWFDIKKLIYYGWYGLGGVYKHFNWFPSTPNSEGTRGQLYQRGLGRTLHNNLTFRKSIKIYTLNRVHSICSRCNTHILALHYYNQASHVTQHHRLLEQASTHYDNKIIYLFKYGFWWHYNSYHQQRSQENFSLGKSGLSCVIILGR